MLPITGIPFSLLSYGGSHLLSLMVALGIVQSIAKHG
jgi:cell division protein FtsW (lipid II flippase)